MDRNGTGNRWKGFIIGAVGSVAGLMAMRWYWENVAPSLNEKVDLGGTDVYPENLDLDDISQVERHPDPEESPTAVLGSMAYERVTGSEPETKETRTALSNLVHWGYGILQGGLYGAARAANGTNKGLDLSGGAAHGLGLWLLGDEVTVPMLGLQEGPTAVSPTGHLNRLGAHLAYGLATAATTQILRRIL
ncbi:MAG: hypothetical protein IPM53_27785 [Anaerolineaceae bacterium]|nr:hypothetical protein [Anaerolineaceae bacterium]